MLQPSRPNSIFSTIAIEQIVLDFVQTIQDTRFGSPHNIFCFDVYDNIYQFGALWSFGKDFSSEIKNICEAFFSSMRSNADIELRFMLRNSRFCD